MSTAAEIGNDFGYRCPDCSHGDQLEIAITRFVELLPNGTGDDDGTAEWNGTSDVRCTFCEWRGVVSRLMTEDVDEAVEQYKGEEGCRTYITEERRVCMAPVTLVIHGRKYCDLHKEVFSG